MSHAGSGVLAACFGMAAAHLVAGIGNPQSSPVFSVGSTVIDATPTPVKDWAIRTFGTADKPILIGSVILVTLIFAGFAGVVARRNLRLGMALTGFLVLLAGAASLSRPGAELSDAIPSVVALILGPLTLAWLVRTLRTRGADAAVPSDAAPGSARRGFLIGSGLVVLGGVAMAGAGQWIVKARSKISDIVLPRAAQPLPPLPAGLEQQVPAISEFQTPNKKFYRVDTKLAVPIVDHNSWKLRVTGMVDKELSFTYDELRDLAVEEQDITLTCVSNTVGGKLVGAARWLGVPITDLLNQAGASDKADQLLSIDVDGFKISTPLEVLTDGRPAMIAIGMNGKVLPREHGFPARLVTPGLYGFVGATKWLQELKVTTYAKETAYWTDRDWATDAPIKLSSRIDTPRPLANLDAGKFVVGGVAWAQSNGVKNVEVRIDGGAWQPVELGPDAGINYWRQWRYEWDATPGSHQIAVRAIGLDGTVQTPVRVGAFPDGSSGIQEIVVNVK